MKPDLAGPIQSTSPAPVNTGVAAEEATDAGTKVAFGSATRFPAFDRLRAFCMFLVILWHAGLPYADNPWWPIHDETSTVSSLLIHGSMGFTMQSFFAISGFFAAMVASRRGLREFVQSRLVRLLVPGLCFAVISAHFYAYAGMVALEHGRPRYGAYHLWFLQYLLIISFVVSGAASILRHAPDRGLMRRLDSVVQALLVNRWGPFLLAIPTGIAQWLRRDKGVLPNPVTLSPDTVILTYYTIFFGFGWLLYRHRQQLPLLTKLGPSLLLAALLTRVLTVKIWWPPIVVAHLGGVPVSVIDAAVSPTFTWLMVFGLIGVFSRYFAKDGALGRYIADSAYWCYVAHLFPLLVVQKAMSHSNLPVGVEYLLICTATCAFCLPTYHYFVRYTFVGRIMNGPRQRRSPAASRPIIQHAKA